MTGDEVKEFLVGSVRTGKLATVRADGRPHVVPIWYELDGDDLLFTTWHTTVKAANMRRDPRVCVCVDEETPPYSYVTIEGTATFTADPAQLGHWARRIAARYMGEDLGDAYGERNGVEGELLVRVTPTRIIAQKNIAD
jgi:PPOX class probable F420-dependent enzyme